MFDLTTLVSNFFAFLAAFFATFTAFFATLDFLAIWCGPVMRFRHRNRAVHESRPPDYSN